MPLPRLAVRFWTGGVIHGPASRPLEIYPAELVNEQVIVTL